MRKSIQLISSLHPPYPTNTREASLCVGHITKRWISKREIHIKENQNSCLIPEKRVTSLLYIVIRTIQSTNFSETIVNNNQFQPSQLYQGLGQKNSSQPISGNYKLPETARCWTGMCYFVKNVMKFLKEFCHALNKIWHTLRLIASLVGIIRNLLVTVKY